MLFQNTEEEDVLPDLFYGTSITWYQTLPRILQEKEITNQYPPTMNIDVEILNKILANWI